MEYYGLRIIYNRVLLSFCLYADKMRNFAEENDQEGQMNIPLI